MGILVTGTVALDTVTTPFGEIKNGLGGSAVHFSMSASHFTDVHLLAVVGKDFPDEHIQRLKKRNVDIEGLERAKGKTFRWTGKYDYDLSNPQTLNTELNVLESFTPKVPASYANSETLFLANIDPALQMQVIDKAGKPQLIACDTMNFWIEGHREALLKTIRKAHLLTINEGEARLLADDPNLIRAAKKIRNMGPKTLVIKQGEYGALLFHDNYIFSAPGLPLEDIKDPTGAGDSFAGGMIGLLDRTNDLTLDNLKQGVILGSVMASFNVGAFSCQNLEDLDNAKIRQRYDEFKHLSQFETISL